ncbi:MAG: helix-turn-helix domain-containing protein [Acidimicrobiia bacterium]
MSIEELTDEAILEVIGTRLRTERLNRNITARDLAERAGISLKTYRNVEAGENHSVASLLRILRALGLLPRVDALLPEPGLSPIELAKLGGKQRRRATGTRNQRDEAWQW